jgi:hypothetical protein
MLGVRLGQLLFERVGSAAATVASRLWHIACGCLLACPGHLPRVCCVCSPRHDSAPADVLVILGIETGVVDAGAGCVQDSTAAAGIVTGAVTCSEIGSRCSGGDSLTVCWCVDLVLWCAAGSNQPRPEV